MGPTGHAVPAPRTAASDALFTRPANPLNVTLIPDSAKAVTQNIGPAGGTLSAVGTDGSRYTLDIPANALPQNTAISMTPISRVDGMPLNRFEAGVVFGPEGLLLQKEALLTIVPTSPVPVAAQTFLGYSAEGKDLHLVPPATPAATIQMRIGHFSGNLLASGTPAQRAAFYQIMALDGEARLHQEVARVLGQERQLAILGVSDGTAAEASVGSYLSSYWDEVVINLALVANTGCNNAKNAQKAYLGFGRQLALLGSEENPFDADESVYKGILKEIDQQCSKLPNRYAGSFTFSDSMGNKVSGTVTFRRDDAACEADGEYTETTACYTAEAVDFIDIPGAPAGCKVSPTSYKVSLSNTPASKAYLRIDLAPRDGTWSYHINALWMENVSPPLTMTCGNFSYEPGFKASGAINSGPVDPRATDMQQLNGTYNNASSRMTYTWVLAGGA